MSITRIVNGWTVIVGGTGEESTVLDVDLAERLGYSRTRDVRKLIERLIADKFLNDSEFCATVAQKADRGRPATEYRLTKSGALKVIMRSDTANAHAVVEQVIHVFLNLDGIVRRQSRVEQLFERIFLPQPAEWERMFEPPLVIALCKLDGIPWDGGRHPRHLASTNRKIYDIVFSTEVGQEIKRRNPEPRHENNHHQQLAPEAAAYLREQLTIVLVIANQSRDKADFWCRMARQYRGAFLQLSMPVDGSPEPEAA